MSRTRLIKPAFFKHAELYAAEAESGLRLRIAFAGLWTVADRERFANDLGDRRSLVGVTDTINQEKSDQDPGTWLPPYFRCRYLKEFVGHDGEV